MPAGKSRLKIIAAAGFAADELLTAAVSFAGCPFRFVMPGSINGEVVPATGASLGAPLGVIQNAPAAGQQARVRMFGKSIVAACLSTCDLRNGTYVQAGSHAGAIPSVCGLANARWAGSTILSAASQAYGEVWLNGPSFATCVAGAS